MMRRWWRLVTAGAAAAAAAASASSATSSPAVAIAVVVGLALGIDGLVARRPYQLGAEKVLAIG